MYTESHFSNFYEVACNIVHDLSAEYDVYNWRPLINEGETLRRLYKGDNTGTKCRACHSRG